MRERHAGWCLGIVKGADDALEPPISQPAAMDRLQNEHANLRVALAWLNDAGRFDHLTLLAVEMTWFWYLGGYAREGLGWLKRVLALRPDRSEAGRMKVLIYAGHLAIELQDPATITYLEEARTLARDAGDIGREARATLMLGMTAEDSGNYADAETLLTTAQTLYAQTDEWWYRLVTGYHLGIVALGQGNSARATALLEAIAAEAQKLGDILLQAWCGRYFALIAYDRGNAERLVMLLRQSRQLHVTSVALHHQRWDQLIMAAALATTLGESEGAARLLGAAADETYGLTLPLPEGAYYVRMAATARERLGNDSYRAAWETGRRMPRVDTLAEMDRLLTAAEQLPVPSVDAHDPTRLTPREQEVLRLLVDGRSNREIAGALFISHRTATTHVTNILAKFAVETRAAAVTYAFQHELL